MITGNSGVHFACTFLCKRSIHRVNLSVVTCFNQLVVFCIEIRIVFCNTRRHHAMISTKPRIYNSVASRKWLIPVMTRSLGQANCMRITEKVLHVCK